MSEKTGWKQFLVIDGESYVERDDAPKTIKADWVLGIVQAEDRNQARATASGVFPGLDVFVMAEDEASPDLVSAAKQKGILNTSQPHRPGFASDDQ